MAGSEDTDKAEAVDVDEFIERLAMPGTLDEAERTERPLVEPVTLDSALDKAPDARALLIETGLIAQADLISRHVGMALSAVARYEIPTELIEQIAGLVAERMRDEIRSGQKIEEDEWMTLDEAAAHMKCGKQRIYDLRSQGRLPKHGDGPRKGYQLKSELDALLREGA